MALAELLRTEGPDARLMRDKNPRQATRDPAGERRLIVGSHGDSRLDEPAVALDLGSRPVGKECEGAAGDPAGLLTATFL